jgi:hypothetical protein
MNSYLENKHNIKIKILKYASVNQIAAAAKAGEVDYIYSQGPWPVAQLNATCFWSTGAYKNENVPRAMDLYPGEPTMEMSGGYWLVTKKSQCRADGKAAQGFLCRLANKQPMGRTTQETWMDRRCCSEGYQDRSGFDQYKY